MYRVGDQVVVTERDVLGTLEDKSSLTNIAKSNIARTHITIIMHKIIAIIPSTIIFSMFEIHVLQLL